ncbi:hypothetical protein KY337_01330 [Candidatus Woesearchaeota archaeon]|nr:hypothetical protein [Candidatus Woesearchaeota archaeon]
MVKKRIWVVGLCFLLIFAVACTSLQREKPEIELDLYKGTRGIEINLLPNAPPTKLYAGPRTQLNFIVELRNRGVYKTSGMLFLGGYDTSIVPIRDSEKDFGPIEGKTEYNQEGGFQTVDFEALGINMPEGLDRLNQPFSLTAIYDYETVATAVVCVDPNPYAPVQPTIRTCIPQDVSLGGGQGAPVAVDLVEVQSSGEKVFFKIHVRNVGAGSVVTVGERDPFAVRNDIERINKVYYDVTMSGIYGTCKPDNPLRLVNEAGIVFCEFAIPFEAKDPYQTTLKIRLSYGYINEIIRNVQFVKTPK